MKRLIDAFSMTCFILVFMALTVVLFPVAFFVVLWELFQERGNGGGPHAVR